MPITPASLRRAITTAAKAYWCTALTITDPLQSPFVWVMRTAEYGARVLPPGASDVIIDSALAIRKNVRAWACGIPQTEPDNPPAFSPPFSGGQCPGKNYKVFVESKLLRGGVINPPVTQSNIDQYGPIRGVVKKLTPLGRQGIYILAQDAGGNPSETLTRQGAFGSDDFVDIRIVDIEPYPAGSGPDDCGDPPVPMPEGGGERGGTYDLEGEDENGNPITIPDVEINFNDPIIDIDGNLIVKVNLPEFDICGLLKLAADGEFLPTICNPGTNDNEIEEQEPVGEGTTEPEEEFQEEEAPDEVTEEESILGVLIISQKNFPRIPQTEVPNDSGPVLLVPRIATCSFKIEILVGKKKVNAWVDPVDIKTVESWVPAPPGVRVLKSAVQWQPSFKGTKQNFVQPWPVDPCPCKSLPDSGST